MCCNSTKTQDARLLVDRPTSSPANPPAHDTGSPAISFAAAAPKHASCSGRQQHMCEMKQVGQPQLVRSRSEVSEASCFTQHNR